MSLSRVSFRRSSRNFYRVPVPVEVSVVVEVKCLFWDPLNHYRGECVHFHNVDLTMGRVTHVSDS